jgi:hypothetical protein
MVKEKNNPGVEFILQSRAPNPSPVNILFTSRSSAGAWQIRGQQIAAMRNNWKAANKPSDEDLEQSDLICIVKKPDPHVIKRARQMGKSIVFDIVDSWPQPEDGMKCADANQARKLFSPSWQEINVDGYIFPTQHMQDDLGALVQEKVTIYHHYWPQIQRNPIRKRVAVIGYEGADYLGDWLPRIEKACVERGIQFIANPSNYIDLDIVILARGGQHGNFLARHYKSNVKLANAYGSGTPALAHFEEMSAHDTDTGDVMFFTDQTGSFERQLDRLVNNYELRMYIHQKFLFASSQFHIENITSQFEGFFLKILEKQRHKKCLNL